MTKEDTIITYLRISSEDKDLKSTEKSESDSISNQRLIVQEYIKNHEDLQGCQVVELLDDGYSGTNFHRPSIIKALELLKERKAQCIIVKDLSRFGRNYIEVGSFLEQVFPFLGIRFIAVNDSYDSNDPSCVGSMGAVFKTMYSAMYSKDLSMKIKSTLYRKAQQGKYINALAPYGYVKTKSNLNTLKIDEEAAAVVSWIFHSYVDGKSKNQIARELNAQMVLTPMRYKEKHGCKQSWTRLLSKDDPIWTGSTVYSILRDERYIGTVLYGKTKSETVGKARQINNLRKDWIAAPNMHEAIVSKELFEQAWSMIAKCTVGEAKMHKSLLERKVRCAVCGRVLTLVSDKKSFYYCKTRQYTDAFSCKATKLYADDVYDAVLTSIRLQAGFAVNAEEILRLKYQGQQTELGAKSDELKRCEIAINRWEIHRKELFQSYFNKQIRKDLFMSENTLCISQQINQQEKIKLLREELKLLQDYAGLDSKFASTFKPYQFLDELTDDIIGEFVESIKVYADNTIEIVWKFSDDLQILMALLKE